MPAPNPYTHPSRFARHWKNVQDRLGVSIHPGNGEHTILFAHGLGCSNEFWETADSSRDLRGTTLVRPEFLGHGPNAEEEFGLLWETEGDPSHMPGVMKRFARQLEHAFLEVKDIGTVHILSHSMGTVPALILLALLREAGVPFTGRFISIEGNLTREDCGLASREMATMVHSYSDYEGAEDHPLMAVRRRLDTSRDPAERLWGANMRFCWPPFLARVAEDLVAWCDDGRAAALWKKVDNPVYIYGGDSGYPEHNRDLLADAEVVEIPGSAHFPMVTRPYQLWPEVVRTIRKSSSVHRNRRP